MTPYSEVFTAIFVSVAGISLMFGAYILRIKRNAQENKIFFALNIALMVWALGLGMALSSQTAEISLMWRRIAATGWGSFFSLLLHFALLLTGREGLLRKKWPYLPLYLPVAINLLVFAVPTGLNPTPFIMVNTSLGWVNVAQNNAWDIYYIVHYLSYTALGLILVWRWGAKSADKKIKSQSRVIVATFLTALALGTLTDMLAGSLLDVKIPQLAPVVILIPVTAIYLSIRRYGMLNSDQADNHEEILNPEARKKIYRYLTIALVAGGFLNFLIQYVMNGDGQIQLASTLILSGIFVLIGAVIQVVNRLNISNRSKDFINILCVSTAIPVVTLSFISFASVTVWAFPFIMITVSLVFNKRVVLRTVAFITLLTQVIVWIVAPEVRVPIDELDFVGRIGIFTIGIGLAMYVNKVYLSRLKENAEQIRLQALVSEISTDFVTANLENIDEKIHSMLAKAGAFFGTDSSLACFMNEDFSAYQCSHLWTPEGTDGRGDAGRVFPAENPVCWLRRIMDGEVVHIPDARQLPDGEEKECMRDAQCRSLVAIPMIREECVMGFLSFKSDNPRQWQNEPIGLLRILANTLADAMAKTEAEREINYMAYYDHLTGLPNRLLFKDRLSQAIFQAGRTGRYLGVIFLDLDSFKTVNDTLGHERGDELLFVIADRLRNSIRVSDTVSRFGGDEFLLLINNLAEVSDIVKVTQNIMAQFVQPFEMKGQEFYITASAGIAMYPADGSDPDKLIKNADIAMYSAKETGKNQYVMCSHEMREAVSSNVAMTTSLYRALSRGEFAVYYQPQVCLQTKRIIGLEALLRWKSPERGFVKPDRFIPLAEQTGLINPIGEWVLREACRQNMRWQMMGLPPMRVAVNISVIQLRNPRLCDVVRGILEETGLDPALLELEITESAATRESDYIIGLLSRLKELGITLSIDDFGTEYSSLSRLKMLPVDRIKMDMQFVHGIEGSDKDKAITKVIINLAKNLGLKVIAEGVETETQLNFLYQKMCDEVQGFYYFRPMPAEQVEAALRNELLCQTVSAKEAAE